MSLELILTIGCQGSGKSTWSESFIKGNPNFLYLSSDKLRAIYGTGSHDQNVSYIVYQKMKQKTDIALNMGQSVLLDSTFIKKSWRKEFIETGRKYKATLIAYVFTASRDVLVERVNKRALSGGLSVPTEVIEEYIRKLQIPDNTEFDKIIFYKK
jgi:predicted kinase